MKRWLLGGVLQKNFPKNSNKFTEECLCYSLFLILLKNFRPSSSQLYWRETPVLVFQNQSLEDHLQNNWTLVKTLVKKRLQERCFSVNFAKFLRASFLLIEHLRMTSSCVYLWILRRFSEHKLLFHVQVAEFQPPNTVKKYFTGAFQAFYTRSRSSHLKAFIYLKFVKTVCKEVNLLWICEIPTRNVMKKALSHILRHVFYLHFLRVHLDYFFRRGLGCVRAQFLSGNVSGK